MKSLLSFKKALPLLFCCFFSKFAEAQFLMDMIDTTSEMGKGFLSIYKKFDRLKMGVYLQPQFQLAAAEGVQSYEGGSFNPNTNNRFSLRRGRIRFDYVHFSEDPSKPSVHFVVQFDGSERGFFTRDFWGRIAENKWKKLSFTAGMFARPFGYEVNLGSSDRESPERGRMSQSLMKIERDLGAMISFEPRDKNDPLYHLKWDLGLFNGQGLTNTIGDYDSYKDLITRLGFTPVSISPKLYLSGGASLLYGGIRQNIRYSYEPGWVNQQQQLLVDSSVSNIGRKLPRRYYGADIQLKWNHQWGSTEWRAELIRGKQTASAGSSETPTVLPELNLLSAAQYVRPFSGAYFYFLQSLVNPKHQLVVKYDWYDPNTKVKGREIAAAGNFSPADIRYDSWGLGYNYYMNENIRWLFYYAFVKNEETLLPGYTSDVKDNVLTCRLQFRF